MHTNIPAILLIFLIRLRATGVPGQASHTSSIIFCCRTTTLPGESYRAGEPHCVVLCCITTVPVQVDVMLNVAHGHPTAVATNSNRLGVLKLLKTCRWFEGQ